jgi:hypothetical protein
MSYLDFIQSKRPRPVEIGIDRDVDSLGHGLMPFQSHIVARALKLGRCLIAADCGLGKTPMQLVWAHEMNRHTNKPVLILAPLAVAQQTKREGDKFGIDTKVCRTQDDIVPGINITNYEMLGKFDAREFGALVLDESSILKSYGGAMRQEITEFGKQIEYRLCCTATPAPNDLIEIINHADFLSVMGGKEIIATYFIQDGNTTHKWRLKGHAVEDFWSWVASWAIAVRKPSDLGFDDGAFILPPLNTIQHVVDGHINTGWLVPIEAVTLEDQRQARRESMPERVRMASEIANNTDGPFLMWCDLNAESEALKAAIPGAIQVRGSDSPEHKTDAFLGFTDGRYRVLVSKPSIAGFGMNWQHCADMAFVGISHSYERYYQAVRRCWRFGQTRQVNAHVVIAETEGAVLNNIERKERESVIMMEKIVRHMNFDFKLGKTREMEYTQPFVTLPNWIGSK